MHEAFLSSADFSQNITFRNTIRSNSLDSDQSRAFIRPDSCDLAINSILHVVLEISQRTQLDRRAT